MKSKATQNKARVARLCTEESIAPGPFLSFKDPPALLSMNIFPLPASAHRFLPQQGTKGVPGISRLFNLSHAC